MRFERREAGEIVGRREQIDERQGSLHAAGGSPLRAAPWLGIVQALLGMEPRVSGNNATAQGS